MIAKQLEINEVEMSLGASIKAVEVGRNDVLNMVIIIHHMRL